MFVDPLAEEFVGWTPYHYVHQNPINLIAPTGMSAEGLSPIFGSDGEYRGNTSEGYTGNILIYDGDINDLEGTSDRSVKSNFEEQIIFSKYSEANMLQVGAKKMDDVRQSMSGDALSKIYTHVASQLSGTIINGCVFNINDLEGGKIHHGPPFNPQKPSSWETYGRVFGNKGWNDKIVGTNRYLYESTVENLQSSIVYHEWWGHIANPFSSKEGYNNHSKAIEAVMNSPLWEKTTPKYKEINQRIYKQMKKDESKRK